MKLDSSHRPWLIGTVVTIALAGVVYAIHAASAIECPRGDSAVGLVFGVLAAACLLFAWLLSARKRVLLLRVGTLTWWMRGHLWLGFLALPLALFHGAFAFGGPLTTVLMVLLIVIVVSGILGAALQHALPGVMTAQVPREHTYEQLDRMRWNLRQEAYELVVAACGPGVETEAERAALEAFAGHPPHEPKKITTVEGHQTLKEAYTLRVVPYLRGIENGASPLADSTQAVMFFDDLRPRLGPSLHPVASDLADICDEARQMVRQSRLHLWLHGWLWIHVPLSMALIVLMFVHAIMALYY